MRSQTAAASFARRRVLPGWRVPRDPGIFGRLPHHAAHLLVSSFLHCCLCSCCFPHCVTLFAAGCLTKRRQAALGRNTFCPTPPRRRLRWRGALRLAPGLYQTTSATTPFPPPPLPPPGSRGTSSTPTCSPAARCAARAAQGRRYSPSMRGPKPHGPRALACSPKRAATLRDVRRRAALATAPPRAGACLAWLSRCLPAALLWPPPPHRPVPPQLQPPLCISRARACCLPRPLPAC